MSLLSNRKELFRTATTKDKLNFFQALFDVQLLTLDLILALLKIVHADLSAGKEQDRSLYKRYAEMIEMLQYYMTSAFQQVIELWARDRIEE